MKTWRFREKIIGREEIMSKQFLAMILVLCVVVVLAINQYAYAQPEGLLLWNKLGSQTEVEDSEVGPDGTFTSSAGNGFIEEGMFGGAYVVDHTVKEPLVKFPIDTGPSPLYKGAIESWARLIEFPHYIPYKDTNPLLLGIPGFGCTFLNCNDGLGGGGLTGQAGANFVAATGPWAPYPSWTYEQVLGIGQAGDWHHYALVWDEDGIDCGGYGTHKVVMFLDGQLNSTYWKEPVAEFVPAEGQLVLAFTTGVFEGSFAIDNVIVWNYPKTDFSDRFMESPIFPVDIDIKPGSYPNSVNLGSNGVVPVAILSSPDLDATQVDPDTVTLAGSGVAVRGKSNKPLAHVVDVNGDSLPDLVVQVETEDLKPEEFQNGYAILTGQTYRGWSIEGRDEINIVPPKGAPPLNPRHRLATTWASIKSKY
jgi:hypothetical protein